MNLRSETERERLLRQMAVSPKKKMEWLYEMHELIRKAYTKKQRSIFWKLRQNQ